MNKSKYDNYPMKNKISKYDNYNKNNFYKNDDNNKEIFNNRYDKNSQFRKDGFYTDKNRFKKNKNSIKDFSDDSIESLEEMEFLKEKKNEKEKIFKIGDPRRKLFKKNLEKKNPIIVLKRKKIQKIKKKKSEDFEKKTNKKLEFQNFKKKKYNNNENKKKVELYYDADETFPIKLCKKIKIYTKVKNFYFRYPLKENYLLDIKKTFLKKKKDIKCIFQNIDLSNPYINKICSICNVDSKIVRNVLKDVEDVPFEIRTILDREGDMFLCVFLKCEFCEFILCPWCYIHGIIEG